MKLIVSLTISMVTIGCQATRPEANVSLDEFIADAGLPDSKCGELIASGGDSQEAWIVFTADYALLDHLGTPIVAISSESTIDRIHTLTQHRFINPGATASRYELNGTKFGKIGLYVIKDSGHLVIDCSFARAK